MKNFLQTAIEHEKKKNFHDLPEGGKLGRGPDITWLGRTSTRARLLGSFDPTKQKRTKSE